MKRRKIMLFDLKIIPIIAKELTIYTGIKNLPLPFNDITLPPTIYKNFDVRIFKMGKFFHDFFNIQFHKFVSSEMRYRIIFKELFIAMYIINQFWSNNSPILM